MYIITTSGGSGTSASGVLELAVYDETTSTIAIRRLKAGENITLRDDSSGNYIEITAALSGIVHDSLSGAGSHSHAEIDTHLNDDTIHYLQTAINHNNILNRGTYRHVQIDAHLDAENPHSGSEPTILAGNTAQYYRGDKTWQTLDKNKVGLGSVDDIQQLPLAYLEADTGLSSDSDYRVPTTKSVRAFVVATVAEENLFDRDGTYLIPHNAGDRIRIPVLSTPGFVRNTSAGVLVGGQVVATGDLPSGIDVTKLSDGSVSDSEFLALNGVSSSIQDQLDGKEPLVTKGDLEEIDSSVLEITGGDGAVIGNVTIRVMQASALQDGYLSHVDWSLFNSKQAHDATLDALTLLDESTGIIVQTSETSFAKRNLCGQSGEIEIDDPDGIIGPPTFRVGNDILKRSSILTDLSGSVDDTTVPSSQAVCTLADELLATVQSGSPFYCLGSGTVNYYTAELNPPISAYRSGLMVNFRALSANDGPAYLSVNELPYMEIVKEASTSLEEGDIEAGQIISVIYDGSSFQVTGGGGGGGGTATGTCFCAHSLSGVVDGLNDTFMLDTQIPYGESLLLFVDGFNYYENQDFDVQEDRLTVSFNTPPPSGVVLQSFFRTTTSGEILGIPYPPSVVCYTTPSGELYESGTTIELTRAVPSEDYLIISKNGLLQHRGTFTVDNRVVTYSGVLDGTGEYPDELEVYNLAPSPRVIVQSVADIEGLSNLSVWEIEGELFMSNPLGGITMATEQDIVLQPGRLLSVQHANESGQINLYHDGEHGNIYSTSGELILNSASGVINTSGIILGAAYNDYADSWPACEGTQIIPGMCYIESGEGLQLAQKRADKRVVGICSDTYATCIGDREHSVPIAVAGYVLAYVDRTYPPGTLLTCSRDGDLTKARWFDVIRGRTLAKYLRKPPGQMYRDVPINDRVWVKVL